MEFTRALYIYELTTVIGISISDLKAKKRKLAKENHPDSGNVAKFSIDEINQAYQILESSINGKGFVDTNSFNTQRFTGYGGYSHNYSKPEQKGKKTISFEEYVDYKANKLKELRELRKGNNLFVQLDTDISIFNIESNKLDEYHINKELFYNEQDSYNINIDLPVKVGEVGELIVNHKVKSGIKIAMRSNLIIVNYPVDAFSSIKIVYTIGVLK